MLTPSVLARATAPQEPPQVICIIWRRKREHRTKDTVTIPRQQFEMLAIWACFCEELHVRCASCQITKPALEAINPGADASRGKTPAERGKGE